MCNNLRCVNTKQHCPRLHPFSIKRAYENFAQITCACAEKLMAILAKHKQILNTAIEIEKNENETTLKEKGALF